MDDTTLRAQNFFAVLLNAKHNHEGPQLEGTAILFALMEPGAQCERSTFMMFGADCVTAMMLRRPDGTVYQLSIPYQWTRGPLR